MSEVGHPLTRFSEVFFRPEALYVIGGLAALATAIALTVIATQKIHFFTASAYDVSYHYPLGNLQIVGPDVFPAVGLLFGAGAAFGVAVVILKHYLAKRMSEWLEKHETVAKIFRAVDFVFTLCAVAAAITLAYICMHYIFDKTPLVTQTSFWSNAFVGYHDYNHAGTIRALVGAVAAGALAIRGVYGMLSIFHRHVASQKPVIVVIPTNNDTNL